MVRAAWRGGRDADAKMRLLSMKTTMLYDDQTTVQSE